MTASPHPATPPVRAVAAGPVVAVFSLLTALLATHAAGVPLRDPGLVATRRMAVATVLVVVVIAGDIVLRSGRARWSRYRVLAVAGALVGFHVTYLAYRNLKSIVPLLRPGELFDRRLGDLDRDLLGGNDPAALLHTLLGTGASAQILSTVYVLFFAFVPLMLAVALVLSPDVQGGLFFVTALSINWLLAAGSYFLLPSLGPIYAAPAGFADLPVTAVSHLQGLLLDQRVAFLRDPSASGAAQGIGAFASLHFSITFTPVVAAHLLGLSRRLKIGLWAWFALTTVATVYFGWHYVIDDLGGLVIGVTALALASALTGFELPAARPLRAPKARIA